MFTSILALALTIQTAQSPAVTLPKPEDTVLTVNGHPIKASEVQPLVWDWYSSAVTAELARYEAIKQEAEKKGIKLTNEEVNTRMATALAQSQSKGHYADIPATEKALKAQGYPLSRLDMGIRLELLVEHLADVEFDPTEYVRVATIVIQPKSGSFDDKRTAMNSASAASTELAGGAKWEAALMKYATDPKTTPNNGDIGWVPISAFPADAQVEIKKLGLNQYSKPVEIQSVYQIFKVEALGKSATPHDVADIKAKFLDRDRRALFLKLIKVAKIDPPLPQ